MSQLDNYRLLCDFVDSLKLADTKTTDQVSNIRNLIFEIDSIKEQLLADTLELSETQINNLKSTVDDAINGKDISNRNVLTSHEIEVFQLGVPADNIHFEVAENSLIPPERGTIIQKLWKVGFIDGTFGYVIVSDTTHQDLSALLNSQISTILSDAPPGCLEDLNITINLSDLQEIIDNNSQDLSNLLNNLEKPGLVSRQLRDIDIDSDPALIDFLDASGKQQLKDAISELDGTDEKQDKLESVATSLGLFSTSLGPSPNLNYSDLKRFILRIDDQTQVIVTLSMPVITWDPQESIKGIPIRDPQGLINKANRRDDGTSYIVDMGGFDPVIRDGLPNPLPPTRFFHNGPAGATETEGALDRYKGGKCLGINTTADEITFKNLFREKDGLIDVTLPPFSAMWKLDKATFDGGNRHAYYTVFSASRPPPAGFMGVVWAPKQNRLGRGRGEIASGVTLANGISSTGKTFNLQNENGPILTDGQEVPSGLKGVTSAFDGHGYDPKDLLKFLQEHNFTKGIQYLTIPANATLETVEDVLIPAGQFIPQINQAVGTLMQFGNGKFVQDGGPNRFQAGIIPFLPGTLAYTPEWHINFIYYNIGEVECDGQTYPITNIATDNTSESWIKPNTNPSFGPPGPNPSNSEESGYSPAFPNTFDPVQLRCGTKNIDNQDYINNLNDDIIDADITLEMLPGLEQNNNIFFTEAPGGALRGWVKFLVVNCPLPVILNIKILGEDTSNSGGTSGEPDESSCQTCTCDRNATGVFINGDLNPIWLDQDDEGKDIAIGDRVLKLKVGDNIKLRATSGTQHGVSIRLDGMSKAQTLDPNKTLEILQAEVLDEIKNTITINNEQDLEHNFIAQTDDLINFHGGIPLTFTPKSVVNPISTPDGVIIADITINEGAQGSSGTIACTVHGSSMSFKFEVCQN